MRVRQVPRRPRGVLRPLLPVTASNANDGITAVVEIHNSSPPSQMSFTPPNHFAVVLGGKLSTNRDVAFAVEAARVQMRDHVAPSWGAAPPGVAVYSPQTFIPTSEGILCSLVDDDLDPSALGAHGALVGMPWIIVDLGQSKNFAGTLTHEIPEAWRNPFLDRWVQRPDGLLEALELADRVQRHYYPIAVELFDERRTVMVSNFLLPSAFQAAGRPPYDWMQVLTTPFEIAPGGYAIVQRDGVIDFLATTDEAAVEAWHKVRKMGDRSRTARMAHALPRG